MSAKTIRLVNKVRELKGTTRHFVGDEHLRQISDITHLVIEGEQDGPCYLLRYTSDRECADTWHLGVDDAKNQADFEYVLEGEWVAVERE